MKLRGDTFPDMLNTGLLSLFQTQVIFLESEGVEYTTKPFIVSCLEKSQISQERSYPAYPGADYMASSDRRLGCEGSIQPVFQPVYSIWKSSYPFLIPLRNY